MNRELRDIVAKNLTESSHESVVCGCTAEKWR
jgi:hypothetical protein